MSRNSSFPKHLKIGVFPLNSKMRPHALKTENGVAYVRDGYVVAVLSEILRFSYELLPSDGFGRLQLDGNWTGLIGLVQRGDVHMALGITVTEERNQLLNFTYPYHFTDVTFVTDRPRRLPKSLAISNPFSGATWAVATAFLLGISLLFYAASYSRRHGYALVLLSVFGSLVQQRLDLRLRSPGVRLTMLFWIVGAMFVTYSYKAVLLASLSFPSLTGIRDIAELSEAASRADSFQCKTLPDSYIDGFLLKSSDGTLVSVGECLQRNKRPDVSEEAFLFDTKTKKAALGSRSHLAKFQGPFHVSGDSFFSAMYAIALEKDFCCKSVLDSIIYKFSECGVFRKFERQIEFLSLLKFNAVSSVESDHQDHHLTLEDLSGAFLVLFFGISVAALVLVAEIIIYHYSSGKLCTEKRKLYFNPNV